jgi:hypothetical protein
MKSERSYRCLYRLLTLLLASEVFLGVVIALVCEYVKLFIQSHFFQFNSHVVLSVIFIIKIYGLHVSICFCCGIVVISLFSDVYTRHLGFLIKLWIFFVIESSIGSLFTTWLFVDTMDFVTSELETSLVTGIKLYTKEPMWVLIFDDLQYDYKCCGVHNHTDWVKLVVHRATKDVSSSWLPFSCAKDKSGLDEENIHMRGCFYVILDIINRLKTIIVSVNVVISIFMVSFIDLFHRIQ